MKYLKKFNEDSNIEEYIKDITKLCLVELEDNGYKVSLNNNLTIDNKPYIISIGKIDQLTNFIDIEDYLMTYIELIGSKSDIKIINIAAFLKDNCEGYISNRVTVNHIQKETLDFNGSYDNFFNYIINRPMISINVVLDIL